MNFFHSRSASSVFSFMAFAAMALAGMALAGMALLGASAGIAQDLSQDEPALSAVQSDEAANEKVAEQLESMRKSFADSGEISKDDISMLADSLAKQFDSFVEQLKDSSNGDSSHEQRLERLVEQRDSFVEQRSRLLCREIAGEKIPGMEFQAFFDACTQLGFRINLNNGLVDGAPPEATRILTLSLPKMDCPGCAGIVRDKLAEIDGVFESATSVELGNCRVLLSINLELDDHLDELAKTTVQFEEWSKE